MSKSKPIERLAPIHKSITYTIAVSVISLMVFGAGAYKSYGDISLGAALFLSLVMIILVLNIASMIISEEGVDIGIDDYQTLDKSLSRESGVLPRLASISIPQTHYYYPAIDTYLTPIFSFSAFFNLRTLLFGVPQAFVLFVFVSDLPLTGLLTAVYFSLCWLAGAALSFKSMCKVITNSNRNAKDCVNMDYSKKLIHKMLSSQAVIYYKTKEKNSGDDLIKDLYVLSAKAAIDINDLIAKNNNIAAKAKDEIEIIEHVINYFVPTTIQTTRRFFSKNSNRMDAAEAVYLKEAAPKIRQEALELNEKMLIIHETIKCLKAAQMKVEVAEIKKQRLVDEKLITLDEDLLTLTKKTTLPLADFSDFHELEFKDIEKRVAAQNIVSGTLMQLIDAREKVALTSEKEMLDAQIEHVKSFVRSLAANTPESKERKERRTKEEQNAPLYLGHDDLDINGIKNMIKIHNRYIDSYDKALPIGND